VRERVRDAAEAPGEPRVAQLSVSMAHISFGTELGFFKQQGLEIEVNSSTQGSFLVMQQLLAGNLDGIYVALESPIIVLGISSFIGQKHAKPIMAASIRMSSKSLTSWQRAAFRLC
jgi:hypothetical protein